MDKIPFNRKEFLRAVEAGIKNEYMKYDLHGAYLGGADLGGADLHGADLRGADLRGADLGGADLRGADLRGADLDFASLPLWCGSLRIKADKRIAAQIAYHFCSLECDDKDFIMARNAIIDFANQFYRVRECGELEHLPQEAE